MTAKAVCYSRCVPSKKMPWFVSILSGLIKPLIDLCRWLYSRPKLDLVYSFDRDEGAFAISARIRLSIQNSGNGVANKILVVSNVFQPRDVYLNEYKFFLDPTRGEPEHLPESSIWDFRPEKKPIIYQYRLKPDIFINPDTTLNIGHFIVATNQDTKPETLSHHLKWTIHCAGVRSRSGEITIDGQCIKDKLLPDSCV